MTTTRRTLIQVAVLLVLAAGLLLVGWKQLPWISGDGVPTGAEARVERSLPGASRAVYACSMHPQVIRDEPGSCPICGMSLERVAGDKARVTGSLTDAGGGLVQVSAGFLQNFSVRTDEVRRGPLTMTVQGIGVLDHDEAKLISVNTKFDGWIERARVNNIGEQVSRGDVLFEVYSPEVVTTQREYLAAIDYVGRLRQGGAYPDAVARGESLLAAARERLRNWDITGAQIQALTTGAAAPRTVQVLAPVTGFIVDKSGDSLEGMRVSPGMTVVKIADHSTLWAKADFYEEDLGHVRQGSRVSVEVEAFPELRREGRILFFRSAVNPETQALTAFIEVANPGLVLRPMMDITVRVPVVVSTDAVLAPVESVLHSGERALVIVARGQGLFEPRVVQVGAVAQDQQEIVAGLSAGERVVVSSQFLIDSESNLEAAISQLLSDGASPESISGASSHHHH